MDSGSLASLGPGKTPASAGDGLREAIQLSHFRNKNTGSRPAIRG